MKQSIQYGKSIIDFDLEYADRKTLGIKVFPDKKVEVIAPFDATEEKIMEKVKQKAAWIQKQQEFFLSFHPLTPPRNYVSGETYLYLGRQYRLKLVESNEACVKMVRGFIFIHCNDKTDKSKIKAQLDNWYKEKAEIHFPQLFSKWLPITKSFYPSEVDLKYRWMKKRWGSCDDKGQITLNIELIKSPKKCIEYVIVHEFCHLAFLNHSKAFYDLLEKHFPTWRETKNYLEHFMV